MGILVVLPISEILPTSGRLGKGAKHVSIPKNVGRHSREESLPSDPNAEPRRCANPLAYPSCSHAPKQQSRARIVHRPSPSLTHANVACGSRSRRSIGPRVHIPSHPIPSHPSQVRHRTFTQLCGKPQNLKFSNPVQHPSIITNTMGRSGDSEM
ncbi:hypothetical protein K491DRAFT_136640 [Lophiostoma macrostomum CBS 122681]|uniref:Uncharacterized protein n=1 Tax=Lophiostoma macrostomum CBS 122681 TaxID=1314788 RepID=A0A6A6TKU6_9PLEO|nr:hypothetical protein K491DRAFT_136640 [Lophiostoma macrostomum CBS 122681]